MSYTTKHKMILQSIMWSKCLIKRDLVEIFKKLQVPEDQLDSYINLINSQLDKFNLNISRGIDDQTGEIYFALICIRENNISKLSSIYTAEQLEVLKVALELLITKNGRFKEKKVVQIILNKNVKFPVIKDIRDTINEFAKEKYFYLNNDGYYYALPRCLIEFNIYFRTYYKDFIKECVLCKQISIRPLLCKHCSTPLHKYCFDRYSREQNKCFGCSNPIELNKSMNSTNSGDDTCRINNSDDSAEDDNYKTADEDEMEVDIIDSQRAGYSQSSAIGTQ